MGMGPRPQDYEHAAPDPLAEAAPGILAHIER